MSVTWSGPSKALQCHIDAFDRIDRARSWIQQHAAQPVSVAEIEAAPFTLRQRLVLMTSMADNIGAVLAEPNGKQIASREAFYDGSTVSTQRDHPRDWSNQYNLLRGIGLVNVEWEMLNKAETHYVSHHVMSTVRAAADVADDEPLFPTDLPCPDGLIVFEYPLTIPDLHPETGEIVEGLEMPIRAIGWHQQQISARFSDGGELTHQDGIFYALYTDEESFKTLFIPSVREHLGEAEYQEHVSTYDARRDPLWCVDTSGWMFGRSWRRSPATQPREAFGQGEIHDTVAKVRRFILALFRFEWSRILTPQIYKPSRPEQKRALRAGLRLQDGYIKVLRLRRHVEMEARGERVDPDQLAYDHQWIVRGHWRRQWFRSLGPARNADGSFNHDSHRLVWIEPHVKGNPFGELVVGHNVTAVVR